MAHAPDPELSTASFPANPEDQDNLPGIQLQNGFAFRKGQYAFLWKLAEAFRQGVPNHLGVFVPGYGKTITALASFLIAHKLGAADKLVVFVPRGNLRDQYADPEALKQLFRDLGAPPLSFCVADSDRVFLKNLRTQIIITTYQYASGDAGHRALLEYCQHGRCMFVFDEVHHLADDGTWASKISDLAFTCSVALSGTPMRSDNKTLFGVPFDTDADGDQYYVALHEVTMRDAHEEGGILKRVQAHVIDYRLQLLREDTGEEVELSLSGLAEFGSSQEIDVYLARQRLRFHEVYLETLLAPAFARFAEKRARLAERMAEAGRGRPARQHQLLIIAMSNRHAAAMLAFVQRRFPQFKAARIGQDVPAPRRAMDLEAYRQGTLDVMVQVDMIGEGTDIKPISVIVKADLVRAYSKTLQQVFRGMRYYGGWDEAANVCDIYTSNDSEVVETLAWMTSEEQIGIRQRQQTNRAAPAPSEPTERSAWHLTQVEHRTMKTHRLELYPGQSSLQLMPNAYEEAAPQVVDVNEREKELRQQCAALATELAYAVQVPIREVHARAKQHLAKSQGDLSLPELERKRRWLERCMRRGRLL